MGEGESQQVGVEEVEVVEFVGVVVVEEVAVALEVVLPLVALLVALVSLGKPH